jgi:S-adenosylmethionine:diacylglycerol 3-amino-3-carboxypropyl transferase
MSQSHGKKQADMITKKDFKEKQQQLLDKLSQIYSGKVMKLSKACTFKLVSCDKRSNKIHLLKSISS